MRRLCLFALLLLVVPRPGVGGDGRGALELRFERLNQVYEGSTTTIAPVLQGLFSFRLTSPRWELELRDHQLRLEPQPDGTHRFAGSGEFLGEAVLEAGLEMGGLPGGTLEDLVTVPLQSRSLEGRVEIEPSDEGYWITTLELPPYLEIEVVSRLGSQLVSWCEQATFLPLSCEGLEGAFSSVQIPLPKPGSRYLLEASELRPEEREIIDGYLDGATR